MPSERHAYLIMAHNNFYILEKLLILLDDPRNDIYIHIDKKCQNLISHIIKACVKGNCYISPKTHKCPLGTQSQVITELLLYKEACRNGPYQYYHLISGVDLPLKTQAEIHHFFEEKHCEYLYFKQTLNPYDVMRVARYHFLPRPKTFASKYQRISTCAKIY